MGPLRIIVNARAAAAAVAVAVVVLALELVVTAMMRATVIATMMTMAEIQTAEDSHMEEEGRGRDPEGREGQVGTLTTALMKMTPATVGEEVKVAQWIDGETIHQDKRHDTVVHKQDLLEMDLASNLKPLR